MIPQALLFPALVVSSAESHGIPGAGDVFGHASTVLHRHTSIYEARPELLDARGFLPELRVGGLDLRHVFVVYRQEPWRCSHTVIPPSFAPRMPSRRLAAVQDLFPSPFAFHTPRDKVRVLTALNAAAAPVAAYNSTFRYSEWGPLVYDEGRQVFAPGTNRSTAATHPSNTSEGLLRAAQDMDALKLLRGNITHAIGDAWSNATFEGQPGPDCPAGRGAECRHSVGVAISVYEDDARRIIVIHGDWQPHDSEYLMWQHKVWVLEELGDRLSLMWTNMAQQSMLPEMTTRKGEAADEKAIRCAFEKFDYQPAPNVKDMAAAAGLPESDIVTLGFWTLLKKTIRVILPAGAPPGKRTFLTGSGSGGAHAALVSMWLAKVDDQKYETYVIAGTGWQCLARRLYSYDMNPWDVHEQIHTYSHVMDVFSNGLDRVSGEHCLFGLKNFTSESSAHHYCSQIVGHTGPQLLYRGEEPEPPEAVANARRAFDSCHYFTHSLWYAALLFADDMVLLIDGKTDGGCSTEDPVPREDTFGKCPLASRAAIDCAFTGDTVQKLPVTTMIAVASTVAGFICCTGLLGFCCLRRVRSDEWVYGKTKSESSVGGCCCLKGLRARARADEVAEDRKEEARRRAKEKRVKLNERKELRQQQKPKMQGAVKKLQLLGALDGAGGGTATDGGQVPATVLGSAGEGEEPNSTLDDLEVGLVGAADLPSDADGCFSPGLGDLEQLLAASTPKELHQLLPEMPGGGGARVSAVGGVRVSAAGGARVSAVEPPKGETDARDSVIGAEIAGESAGTSQPEEDAGVKPAGAQEDTGAKPADEKAPKDRVRVKKPKKNKDGQDREAAGGEDADAKGAKRERGGDDRKREKKAKKEGKDGERRQRE